MRKAASPRAPRPTPGSSAADGTLITRPLGPDILPGITRAVAIEAAKAQGLAFVERPFTLAEAYGAREAFITSASQIVLPVTRIDGRPIGDGAPGPTAKALRRAYHEQAEFS